MDGVLLPVRPECSRVFAMRFWFTSSSSSARKSDLDISMLSLVSRLIRNINADDIAGKARNMVTQYLDNMKVSRHDGVVYMVLFMQGKVSLDRL